MMCYILCPVKQLLAFWEHSFVILLLVSCMIDVPACLRFHYLTFFFLFSSLLFVTGSFRRNWLFVIIAKEMLCKMWNSKRCWLLVKRTSSASNWNIWKKLMIIIKQDLANPWSRCSRGTIYEFSYFLKFLPHIQSVPQ